jgi:hypothetical protein
MMIFETIAQTRRRMENIRTFFWKALIVFCLRTAIMIQNCDYDYD